MTVVVACLKRTSLCMLAFLVLTAHVAAGVGGAAIAVDGYDLTAALSAMPLKEAYAGYFKIGVGLNGSSVPTDTVNSRR